MSTQPSAALCALAQLHGIATDFWDWQGRHTVVSAATIRAALRALDIEATTEDEIAQAHTDAEAASWRRVLPPTVVAREAWTPWIAVHVPHGSGLQVEIVLESGEVRRAWQVDNWVEPRQIDGVLLGEATVELPGDLPCGWHRIEARVTPPRGAADSQDTVPSDSMPAPTATATLIVTPSRIVVPAWAGDGAQIGLMAQLYQARSADSWGIGDLHDLGTLAQWSGRDLGSDFILVNPLHATAPIPPMEPSPYLPTTRRFVSPLYLRVEDIPEVAALDEVGALRLATLGEQARQLNGADTIDRDAVWSLKREALELVHAAGLSGPRAKSFAAFVERQGQALRDFATWSSLADRYGLPSSTWPRGLEGPHSSDVVAIRVEEQERIAFHSWMQWVLDEQLAAVQQRALSAGMNLGLIHDLAVGVHPDGADAWGLSDALANGVTVGAPPDQFNQLGQNWSQPPWRPDRLAELGYAPFRDMVRAVLKDAGGVRVDHIIGLFRLWWIPQGASPAEGTYVRYDHEALIGILALEAQRAGAVIIGEDLGVVEPATRDYLLERGLFGTSIMWFEWADGQPLPPERYRQVCFSSVTTHDLPPTAGYLALEHVEVRERLGLLTRPVEVEKAHEHQAIAHVTRALVERGLLAAGDDDAAVTEAMHAWLAQTPSRLLGMALADVVGDRRAVNQPGTHREYPNWSVPLAGPDGRPLSLEEAMASPLAPRLAAALRGTRLTV